MTESRARGIFSFRYGNQAQGLPAKRDLQTWPTLLKASACAVRTITLDGILCSASSAAARLNIKVKKLALGKRFCKKMAIGSVAQ
jgi:hypothetical protein